MVGDFLEIQREDAPIADDRFSRRVVQRRRTLRAPLPTMKKTPARKRINRAAQRADPARRVGGQPENDEDARAAGLKSATSEAPRKKR